MMYSPPMLARPSEVCITPWSYQSLGVGLTTTGQGTSTSQNWITANVGVFVPFTLPEPVTVTKMFWSNGTAVAGNIDVGIFDEAGVLLVSLGSTAQSGISAIQIGNITDTLLQRGRYYIGMTSDTSGITQKVFAATGAGAIFQALGVLQDTSCAPPLATNANPATYVAYNLAFLPHVGLMGFRTVGP